MPEALTLRQAIHEWLLSLFHVHKWVDTHSCDVTRGTDNGIVRTYMVQRCSVCGDYRTKLLMKLGGLR